MEVDGIEYYNNNVNQQIQPNKKIKSDKQNCLYNIEIRNLNCNHLNCYGKKVKYNISHQDISNALGSCHNFLSQSTNIHQQILYVLVIQSVIDQHKLLVLKIGTTTVGGLEQRMKNHAKTFGKYFMINVFNIDNESIEKNFHKILKNNLLTSNFYPKDRIIINSVKQTECYYLNNIVLESINFLMKYINSYKQEIIDYELYAYLKEKFPEYYQYIHKFHEIKK